LCLALGHGSIAVTQSLPAAEFAFWAEFYRKYGFPVDRLEGVAAKGAAYVCGSNGMKVDPREIVPKWGRGKSAKVLAAGFAGIPGARVERKVKEKPADGR
jgi:hypothetical protein